VNNIVLEAAKAEWRATESVWGDSEHRDVMLSDEKLVAACRSLQAGELTATPLKDWRPALSSDRDDDETDSDEDELEGSQELDEESLFDEDEETEGFAVKSFATTSASRARSSVSGRKKPAMELQDNEDLGFPTIVVNFKKQKKIHKS
jgi:hypothetical protein